jgi:hypothetical protein
MITAIIEWGKNKITDWIQYWVNMCLKTTVRYESNVLLNYVIDVMLELQKYQYA